ncbi:hypothetical protein NA57DRAFT_57078 [Rhizodiscina lignyota]|uniref:Uncharacterized protein n=1 Tax=Rhizodiscina lignyota TaxID=1504668 RepID=A0A9P4M5C4_9PEZI|nr:hypothetical protein NA57DRAFT_57078 [Rhizodiscina lignyota]
MLPFDQLGHSPIWHDSGDRLPLPLHINCSNWKQAKRLPAASNSRRSIRLRLQPASYRCSTACGASRHDPARHISRTTARPLSRSPRVACGPRPVARSAFTPRKGAGQPHATLCIPRGETETLCAEPRYQLVLQRQSVAESAVRPSVASALSNYPALTLHEASRISRNPAHLGANRGGIIILRTIASSTQSHIVHFYGATVTPVPYLLLGVPLAAALTTQ